MALLKFQYLACGLHLLKRDKYNASGFRFSWLFMVARTIVLVSAISVSMVVYEYCNLCSGPFSQQFIPGKRLLSPTSCLQYRKGNTMENNYDIVSDLYDTYVQFDFDVNFFIERYSHFKGNDVVELMAGTGRLSIPLLKNGVSLDCVDLSEGLLDKLRNKLIANKLRSNVFCQNICMLQIPHKYDAVIIGCNSFAEIIKKEDRDKVIRSVHGLLNGNGEFVITLHNPVSRRKLIDRRLNHVGTFENDGKIVSFSISSHEDQNAIVHLNQFYEIYNNNGCMVEKRMIALIFALISKNEMENELIYEGFNSAISTKTYLMKLKAHT
jgi:SAM-dependent methyltransferase